MIVLLWQKDTLVTGLTFGTEDCLNVGVFTKTLSGKRPVLVWIHGGGFVIGSPDLEPDMLMDQDLV